MVARKRTTVTDPARSGSGSRKDVEGNLISVVEPDPGQPAPSASYTCDWMKHSDGYYDANGNMTSGAGLTMKYDEANRLISAMPTSGGTVYYGYAPDNKRIYALSATGTETFTLWGAQGEKLGNYQFNVYEDFDRGGNYIGDSVSLGGGGNIYFDGRLVNGPMYVDRLGSDRSNGARYYPYGDEITSTSNDRTKFATYNRDAFTGLDYAKDRYYSSAYGRFNTPDRAQGSAKAKNPTSWNRYVYSLDDPINKNDPSGRCYQDESGGFRDDDDPGSCSPDGGEYFGGADAGENSTTATAQIDFVPYTQAYNDLLGWLSTPLSSSDNNPYSSNDTYSGASAQCMFLNGGDNPWGDAVRGCLAVMYLGIPPGTSYTEAADEAHQYCYWTVALSRTGLINTTWGFGAVVNAYSGCVMYPAPMPVFQPSIPMLGPVITPPSPVGFRPGQPLR